MNLNEPALEEAAKALILTLRREQVIPSPPSTRIYARNQEYRAEHWAETAIATYLAALPELGDWEPRAFLETAVEDGHITVGWLEDVRTYLAQRPSTPEGSDDLLTLLIPKGSRVTFDQDRLGVVQADQRTDGTTVLLLDPKQLSQGVPNPRPSGRSTPSLDEWLKGPEAAEAILGAIETSSKQRSAPLAARIHRALLEALAEHRKD